MFAVLALGLSACVATVGEPIDPQPDELRPYALPDRVIVRPIFFVASDQRLPGADQQQRLVRHLGWARDRYAEMLGHRDTFEVAGDRVEIVRGTRRLDDYVAAADLGASQIMAELLDHVRYTRFNNPFIFVTIVMNATGTEPAGAGRPCNGGLDGGGGLLIMASATLDSPNFQSTLQHELGHAFGLPHVDAYGLDIDTNASIMSYNTAHWTDGFAPSPTPGILIPEDIHALAMNDRAFSALAFDPARDVPASYRLAPVVPLGAMEVPNQPPNAVAVGTLSGELFDSAAANVVQGRLLPSRGPDITFDPSAMWHSDVTSTGTVELYLQFPLDVTLDEIRIHSQHSGQYHAAVRVRIEAQPPDSSFTMIAERPVAVDDSVRFPPTSSRTWRLVLFAGESQMVVIRGLQFFVDGGEVFPPFVPDP